MKYHKQIALGCGNNIHQSIIHLIDSCNQHIPVINPAGYAQFGTIGFR